MVVRLFESLRAVFYTPYYLALALRCYERRGLEVSLGRPERPADAALSVFNGSADVTWGGPMRMMQHIDRQGGPGPDGKADIVGFAEAVTRDPFYLVGREPLTAFTVRDLLGKRFASVSEVPTPWQCLADDLRRSGLDPQALDRIDGRGMSENADALRAGELDVIQVFEPFVQTLVAEGSGHIWYSAASRGPTSYTTWYTSRAYAESNPQVLAALAAGLHDAQQWLHANPPAAIAEQVQPYFEEVAPEILAGAIERYRANGVWGRDPVLPVVGFVRLKSALLAGGFIERDIPFDSCIDNRFALQAIGR
ncbi:MAG: ABC transporter substrate-binding protein [Gammaproteobacteria bacterium]|nr:ABC transporter substrate-binding protein [Gammaproteobacteria bacterium]